MTTLHSSYPHRRPEGSKPASTDPIDVATANFAPLLADLSEPSKNISTESRLENHPDLFQPLVERRREFWVELLSFPAPQDRWLATLTRVANGELRHDGPTIFGGAESAMSVNRLIDAIRPLKEALGHARCEDTAFSLRRDISMLLVEMPIFPEPALSWANEMVAKSASLARLEERLTTRSTDFTTHDAPSEDDWAKREALREELGGVASTVRQRVGELTRVRDAYLTVRDELFERNSHLADPYARWRRTPPALEGADFAQEARIGLLRAIERAPGLSSLPFTIIADTRMAGQVREFIRVAGQLVRVPESCSQAARRMRNGKASEDNTRFLKPDEVGARMGLDSSNAQAIGRLSLPPRSLSSMSWDDMPSSRRSAGSQSPLNELEARESQERLRGALGALREEDRLALELRFGVGTGQEKTFKEIGDALGCSEPTAFRRVAVALSRLRARMSRS